MAVGWMPPFTNFSEASATSSRSWLRGLQPKGFASAMALARRRFIITALASGGAAGVPAATFSGNSATGRERDGRVRRFGGLSVFSGRGNA